MKVIRVFPRKTNATPDDELVRFSAPQLVEPECDEVHVSVTFTYDLDRGKRLADAWERVYPGKVYMGGPATNAPGGEFVPGKYLKHGYVITSRGCPNKCWFCSVRRREGRVVRELEVRDGWNVLDDNLLACSEAHIRKVFAMLMRQSERVQFTGGLEAARLADRHVELLAHVKPAQVFFAYDTPDDYAPLVVAGKKLSEVFSFRSKILRCYVLCGYPKDSIEAATKRMWLTIDAGFWPMAMLYRDKDGRTNKEWRAFQKIWARPASIYRQVYPKSSTFSLF